MASFYDIAIHDISSQTDKIENVLRGKIKYNKETLDMLKTKPQSELRRIVERVWPNMELALHDLSELNGQIDYSIGRLNEIKNLINEFNELISDIQIYMNKAKIGTLEGLARDTIKKSRIVPPEDDIIQTSVLEQSYDETAATNRGGKHKRRKTRKIRKRR